MFFVLACIPKYIDKPIKRITSNEVLFPRISISIFSLDISNLIFTYLNSSMLFNLSSLQLMLQTEYKTDFLKEFINIIFYKLWYTQELLVKKEPAEKVRFLATIVLVDFCH